MRGFPIIQGRGSLSLMYSEISSQTSSLVRSLSYSQNIGMMNFKKIQIHRILASNLLDWYFGLENAFLVSVSPRTIVFSEIAARIW